MRAAIAETGSQARLEKGKLMTTSVGKVLSVNVDLPREFEYGSRPQSLSCPVERPLAGAIKI